MSTPRTDPDLEPIPVNDGGEGADHPDAGSWMSRTITRLGQVKLSTWVTWLVLTVCVTFTLYQLHPDLLVSSSTPAGGDMGAHVWAPAYLRDHLLPNWRLTGWSPDWYAGLPALHFYMVPPMLAIVALDVFLPYGTAFKFIAVSGIATLPIAVWGFGRLARLKAPVPELLAIGSVGFLFDNTFDILGGNILSTLAGEFSFSISLSLAVIYLGLVADGLRTGRRRGLAAVVVGLCALTHVIPLFFAIAGTFVLLALRPSMAGLRWIATSAPVGALLSMWWLLPFWGQRTYMNDMGWEKKLPPDGAGVMEEILFWVTRLFPAETRWVAYVGLAGAVLAIWRRSLGGLFFAAMILVGSVAFVVVPQGRLWNERLLPFIHLCTYLLAAYGVGEAIRLVSRVARGSARRWIQAGGTATAMVVALVIVAIPLQILPFGSYQDDGAYRWPSPPLIGDSWPLAVETTTTSPVRGWAEWNFTGYQGKSGFHEYRDLVITMDELGRTNGCGRSLWEYNKAVLDPYGTPMALMLLPMWTGGCIGSMEGLYFETSTTTPFHFLAQSSLSESPSRAQREMPYTDFDISLGVRQMQLLGVRYYMATTQLAVDSARAHPDLTELEFSGPWTIFEVADAPLVAPLGYEPVVRTDIHDAMHEWVPAAAPWFQAPGKWDLLWASSGPEQWQRTTDPDTAERRAQPEIEVTEIEAGTDSVRFEVSEVGVPVLVKVSYFPNWKVTGADGPYRVTPNFMVVVPTQTTVELNYGYSTWEMAGWGLTGIGVILLFLLSRARPLSMPVWPDDHDADDDDEPTVSRVPSHRPVPEGDLRLSVVIPAYNEGRVIANTVTTIRDVLGDLDGGLEIVVVDDGSTDDTSEAATSAGAHRVIRLEPNAGKGAAVRAGALAATGRTVAFTDADLAYAPDQILPLVHQIEAGWDVVVGSRQMAGSTAEVPASWLRRVGGRVVNLLVRLVLAGDHADTQCGLKAFRRDVAQLLFSQARVDGFAFDVELFALAERHQLSLTPSPVRVVNSTGSSVRITSDTAMLVLDLLRISWWLRRDGYPPVPEVEVEGGWSQGSGDPLG